MTLSSLFRKVLVFSIFGSVYRCMGARFGLGVSVRVLLNDTTTANNEILSTKVESKVVCFISCNNDNNCSSISYDTTTNECKHFSGFIQETIEIPGIEQTDKLYFNKFRPKDCTDVYKVARQSGVYTIYPDGGNKLEVVCKMDVNGSGWTVFQHRQDGSVDFYRDWEPYKVGFGSLASEFWLGNENIHTITEQGEYTLRVDMEDFEGNTTSVEYTHFAVGPESDQYRLKVGAYSGDMDDSLRNHQNGSQFSTKDRDNDRFQYRNCAEMHKGCWWYGSCHRSNLNGLYLSGPYSSNADGVCWKGFRGLYYSLKKTSMMMKRNY